MNANTFQVGDKVTLRPECTSWVATVPALVPGRVYCVERVNISHNTVWLRLVGVREHKHKCCDDRGPHSAAFRLIGSRTREAA